MANIPKGFRRDQFLDLFYLSFIQTTDSFQQGAMCQYADDTSIVLSGSTYQELSIFNGQAVHIMQEWCRLHNLKLNFSKTNLMQSAKTSHATESMLVRECGSSPPTVSKVSWAAH